MNGTFSSAVFVVGTTKKLLMRFQTFSSAEVQFGATIRAIYQAGKQTLPPGLGVSPLVFSQFLHSQPSVFIDNSFLCIRYNLMLLLRFFYDLMNLVTDCSAFTIGRAIAILIAVGALGNETVRIASIWTSLAVGLPGLILQLTLLPLFCFRVDHMKRNER